MASLPRFDQLKHVHITGVCGTLMGSFAAYLSRKGIRVSGSDQNIYPPMSDVLKAARIELMTGYSAENLSQFSTPPDLVVIGNVISASNPEAIEANSGRYAVTSLPEAMERLLLVDTLNCVVAGTHGKTTTSSLLAFTLRRLGKSANYFIGGVSADLPHSFQVDSIEPGVPFVLEGDEYDTAYWDKVPKFNHYLPDHVILTSIEYDHADIYPDFDAVKRAFRGLMERIRPGGHLIYCSDDDTVTEMTVHFPGKKYSYGSIADKRPDYLLMEQDGAYVLVSQDGNRVKLAPQLPGKHNALNAAAVLIECMNQGYSADQAAQALAQFRGVKRRQEERGEVKGVLVIDDFAHHPTAVRETILALKRKYAGRRLITVFEPRSATSRRKVFQNDYVDAFAHSDLPFIAVPFDQSKIAVGDQFSSQELVKDLADRNKSAYLFQSADEGVESVARIARTGDVIAVLSNGGFDGFIAKLLKRLESL